MKLFTTDTGKQINLDQIATIEPSIRERYFVVFAGGGSAYISDRDYEKIIAIVK